jgi:hypothetical protein
MKWFQPGVVDKRPGANESPRWRGSGNPRPQNAAPGASRRWNEGAGGETHPLDESTEQAIAEAIVEAEAHAPVRPEWRCPTCRVDWPCDPAKEQLTAAYGSDRVALSVQMSIELQRAAGELPAEKTNVTDLHYRFVGWTR